ncbi:MAG: hypothetical protein QNK85_08010 [Crocinitomicaceae bacterium]
MKPLFILSLFFLSSSCSTQKEIPTNTDKHTLTNIDTRILTESEVAIDTMRVIGTVHIEEKGCLIYIDAKTDSGNITMYPVNLAEKFKREGFVIRFTYTLSRAMQPNYCKCSRVVSLRDVTPLRK